MNQLENEILRKLDRMNLANADMSNGMHISTYHVGLSDEELLRRKKQDRKSVVSSFTDANTVDVLLYDLFSDEYFIEKNLIPYLRDNSIMEKEFENFSFDGPIGRAVLPNGGIKKVSSYRIVLTKNIYGGGERDTNTGMPFSVVTMYPIVDED